MLTFLRCLFGPRLHFKYEERRTKKREYLPLQGEIYTDKILQWASQFLSLIWYTSPIIAFYLWRKGAFTFEAISGWKDFSKLVIGASAGLAGAHCIRGLERYMNPEYRNFVEVLSAVRNGDEKTSGDVRDYEFDFAAWPIDFSWKNAVVHANPVKRKLFDSWSPGMPTVSKTGLINWIIYFPYNAAQYWIAHVVGRRAMYPGSTAILQKAMTPHLFEGRSRLITEFGGYRLKLQASDGNEIDSMFVDSRGKSGLGNKLVICCEGNAAFYELGCMMVPLQIGYSVLGWNHPGFAGSSGLPFPSQERNAIDIVIQYAVDVLGFQFEDIVLFSWSIGGFTSTYAAAAYPDISALILDATFDDVMPLALLHMPNNLRPFIKECVKNYLHLNNAGQLEHSAGPVLIIRRLKDEMISTVPGNVKFNRGNYLITKMFKSRYPNLFNEDSLKIVNDYLCTDSQSRQIEIVADNGVDSEWCLTSLQEHAEQHGKGFPFLLGTDLSQERKNQLSLFLVTRHLIDFAATHCVQFPPQEFRLPWSL